MIVGIGLDLVETQRIANMIERWGSQFKDRIYTVAEQNYCDYKKNPNLSYAGRWAIKEAVSKAFGTGIGGVLSWLDIGIENDQKSGAPSVVLSQKGQEFADSRGISSIMVSLSHTHEYAVAQAIIQ